VTPPAARRPHPGVAAAAAATPPAPGQPTPGDGADFGRGDRRTARLLHVVLGCDLTALLTVEADRLCAWLTTWTADGRPRLRSARGGRALGAAVATRLASAGSAPFPWAGEPALSTVPECAAMRGLLVIPLVVGAVRSSAWLLGRRDGGFIADEVDHAALLAPGLRMRRAGAEPARRPAMPPLTARELQVLELVSAGATAGAVARDLGISERTVQKHLEHVYGKLGCQDRVSAVLRVWGAGLLPGGGPAPAGDGGP
jgi:DNA-binding CsgD family transcriptional regulator